MSPLRLDLVVWLSSAIMACQPRPFPPELPRHPNGPIADASVSTRGLVVSVERPRPEDSKSYVHVLISAEDRQPIRLILAPGWYLDQHGIRFEPEQAVTASGKRAVHGGQPSIVVERISTSQGTLLLRDEQDHPVWSR
jgi:hypothetical protein